MVEGMYAMMHHTLNVAVASACCMNALTARSSQFKHLFGAAPTVICAYNHQVDYEQCWTGVR